MASSDKHYFPIVLTIALGILTIVAPILWDYLKYKSELQLQLLSKTTLIEKESGLEKLRVLYNGEDVQKLTRYAFLLVNTGRTPILKDDLIVAPRIEFNAASKILEYSIDGVSFKGIEMDITPNDARNAVSIEFPLMNHNDHILFSVLVEGAASEFTAMARIKNIDELHYIDRTEELAQKKRRPSWLIYPVGFFSIVFLIAPFAAMGQIKKVRKTKEKYLKGKIAIPILNTKNDYLYFLSTEYNHIDGTSRVKKQLRLLPDDVLTEKQIGRVRAQLEEALQKEDSSYASAFGPFIFAALGIWYILHQIL